MAETGDLIIKIGGDASKFKATIADVENSLKSFKANLGTTGLNIKIEALGFQETKSNIKSVTDFAEGTLGAIKNTIKEVKAERLTISADPNSLAPFNIKLNELNTTVKELEKAGIFKDAPQQIAVAENSIQGLSNRIADLRKERAIIDPDTNARAILQINQQIERLEEKLGNLNVLGQKVATPEGFTGSLKKVVNGSKEAGRAITSLSLIAQDLPFGFIAIQNNLPALASTFEAVKNKTEDTKSTFAAFKDALIGPAGFYLAFSAVNGIITYAIQEYGSLGEAINAVFGKTNALLELNIRVRKSYEEYTKQLVTTGEAVAQATGSQQGQIGKAQALVSIVTDLTRTEKERATALNQLKELDKDRFEKFDIEIGKYNGLTEAVNGYTNSLIANAIANKLADRASDLAIQERQASNLANETFLQQQKLLRSRIDINDELAIYEKRLREARTADEYFRAGIGISQEAKDLKAVNEKLLEQDNIAKKLRQELSGLKVDLKAAVIEANKFKIVPDGEGKGISDVTNKVKGLKEELRGVVPLFDIFSPSKEQFNFDALKDLLPPNFLKQLKESQRELNATEKVLQKFREGNGLNLPTPKISIDRTELGKFNDELTSVISNYKTNFESLSDVFDDVFSDIIDKNKQIASSVEGFLIQPMQTFFDILTKDGETSWKDFGKVVIDTLKRIASQAITTAIAKTIANIIAPGFGSISTEGLAAGYQALYGESITDSANFGAIRGNQGVNMNGQVVMTLRGSDLVGVMNRTNTTINRVG